MYDALRIDAVQRWLYLADSEAPPESLHQGTRWSIVSSRESRPRRPAKG